MGAPLTRLLGRHLALAREGEIYKHDGMVDIPQIHSNGWFVQIASWVCSGGLCVSNASLYDGKPTFAHVTTAHPGPGS